MQGLPIASGVLTTSTSESANQVQATYDYVGAGKIYLYARGSAATVLATLMVGGKQICRSLPVVFFGTSGAMDTSAHLISAAKTLGGRVELTFRATTATPTVDFLLSFDELPLGALGRAIPRLLGR